VIICIEHPFMPKCVKLYTSDNELTTVTKPN
jgi:hypothetical protein